MNEKIESNHLEQPDCSLAISHVNITSIFISFVVYLGVPQTVSLRTRSVVIERPD
jgi:ACR3 family arsenite efflux pump ArsB